MKFGKTYEARLEQKKVDPQTSYQEYEKTLPKAQRTRGLSSSYQSNLLRSYHNFTNLDQISSPESRLKNQFLNQTSASPIKIQNLDPT